jgi:hypothetical protein
MTAMSSELGIRLGAFLAVCLLMAAWERVAARRTLILPRTLRWPANLGILALDAALDRILGTYRDRPAAGHDGMTIGLAQFQEERRQTLPWLLLLPFRGGAGRNPIGRSGNRGAEISQNPIGPMEEDP